MDWKKLAWASAGVAGVSYGLSWAYGKFFAGGIANLTFAITPVDINVGKQIASGLDTSLAGKLLSYLGGNIPSGVQPVLMLLVAAFLVVLAGVFLNEQLFNIGKTANAKFAFELTLGSVAIGLIAGYLSPSIGAIGTAVSMLIYFVIVVAVYNLLRKIDGVDNVLVTP